MWWGKYSDVDEDVGRNPMGGIVVWGNGGRQAEKNKALIWKMTRRKEEKKRRNRERNVPDIGDNLGKAPVLLLLLLILLLILVLVILVLG